MYFLLENKNYSAVLPEGKFCAPDEAHSSKYMTIYCKNKGKLSRNSALLSFIKGSARGNITEVQ
jgi:hypothetical protein